jgi:hypothetical protein
VLLNYDFNIGSLLPVEYFFINVNYFGTGFVPSDAVYLVQTVLAQLVVHGGVGDDGVDSIGHCVNVPVVGFDDIGEDFGASALLGYDRRHTHLHCLKRRNAERLGY